MDVIRNFQHSEEGWPAILLNELFMNFHSVAYKRFEISPSATFGMRFAIGKRARVRCPHLFGGMNFLGYPRGGVWLDAIGRLLQCETRSRRSRLCSAAGSSGPI